MFFVEYMFFFGETMVLGEYMVFFCEYMAFSENMVFGEIMVCSKTWFSVETCFFGENMVLT